MHDTPFFRLGKLIYTRRIIILLVFAITVICCLPFIPNVITPFKTIGFLDQSSESAKAKQEIQQQLGYNSNKFIIIYHSNRLIATSPLYISKLRQSTSGLKHFPLKHIIIFPDENTKQIAKDQHTAYTVVLFRADQTFSPKLMKEFKKAIKTPAQMSMKLGGEALFIEAVSKQTQKDLYNADYLAAPVSLIILILVFESLIAALCPIFLGGGCALIVLISLYLLGHVLSLSIFTLNIALLLGLCLSLDYSLFVISRFRSELDNHQDIKEVIATTIATAGKAIFFSGLAVFISLSALLLFPINILFSIGIGGMLAVFAAVIIAIIVLPAILALLNKEINLLPIRIFSTTVKHKFHFWRRLAGVVVKRPFTFFVISLIILLLLGLPFLRAHLNVADYHILPEKAEGRQFFELYKKKFNKNELDPIILLVSVHHGNILAKDNITKLIKLNQKLQDDQRIAQVNSIVSAGTKYNAAQYHALYTMKNKTKIVDKLLKTTTAKHLTIMTVVSKFSSNSLQTKKLINELREIKVGKNLSLKLTGEPVSNMEVVARVVQIFPYATLWIMILTYIILLILLRSLFLPLKAIIMNILSLSASYGVLVFVFQEGHLHQYLNFDPQGMLDISLLVIIFCALFGFSMDYEVFLLTRIKEFFEQTHNNEKSIIFGIEQSSKIITSAAIIVISICASFMVANVLLVKEFGLGIAVAIFVDAFLVRTILVPATMVLIKQWNWYLPKWLSKILPKL